MKKYLIGVYLFMALVYRERERETDRQKDRQSERQRQIEIERKKLCSFPQNKYLMIVFNFWHLLSHSISLQQSLVLELNNKKQKNRMKNTNVINIMESLLLLLLMED